MKIGANNSKQFHRRDIYTDENLKKKISNSVHFLFVFDIHMQFHCYL